MRCFRPAPCMCTGDTTALRHYTLVLPLPECVCVRARARARRNGTGKGGGANVGTHERGTGTSSGFVPRTRSRPAARVPASIILPPDDPWPSDSPPPVQLVRSTTVRVRDCLCALLLNSSFALVSLTCLYLHFSLALARSRALFRSPSLPLSLPPFLSRTRMLARKLAQTGSLHIHRGQDKDQPTLSRICSRMNTSWVSLLPPPFCRD